VVALGIGKDEALDGLTHEFAQTFDAWLAPHIRNAVLKFLIGDLSLRLRPTMAREFLERDRDSLK